MDARASEPGRSSFMEGAAPFDINRAISVLQRRMKLFLAVALLVIATVAFITMKAKPQYTAASTVMIDQHKRDVLSLDSVAQGLPSDSGGVDTEVEVLRSRSLASKVVDDLKLEQDPEFNGTLRPPGMLARVREFIAHLAPVQGQGIDPYAHQREHESVVDAVLSKLEVRRVGLTYVIATAFTSLSPVKAAEIANTFAQRYLTEQLDAKFEETRNASQWLQSRLNELRGQVETADAAVQQYKIANNLMSAQGATLTEQEISQLDQQLASARAQDAEQDARLRTAQSQLAGGSNGGDVGEALNSPVVQGLRAQRSAASARLADLQGRYGERHPEMLKAKRELADIDTQIQVEIQRVISNLKAQSVVAHTRTAALSESVTRSRGALAGNNRASVRLMELQRNDDAVRLLYDTFLTRFKENSAKQGTEQTDARVVSPAKLPSAPSKPNKQLDAIIAILLGGAAGLGSVVLAELLESGLSTAEEVERELDLPYLGDIPTLSSTLTGAPGRARLDPITYVVEKPLSSFSEVFRNLRASILLSRTGQVVKVIAITSSLPGEGKTTTALCLARTLALAGSKVVVVDCDLRQRSINRILSGEPEKGLLEVLNGTATLDEAMVRDDETGAAVLPLAKTAFTPKDVFGAPAMATLLAELRQRFDVVILDTAPVLAVADTRILAPQADAVVFLARWRKTSRKAAQSALRALSMGDAYVAGLALTQVNIREQARSGSGNPAYYYRAYRKYYTG